MTYESIGSEFLRISRATSKTEDLSCTYKHLLSRMLKQNWQMRRIKLSLIEMIQQHQKVLLKITNQLSEARDASHRFLNTN